MGGSGIPRVIWLQAAGAKRPTGRSCNVPLLSSGEARRYQRLCSLEKLEELPLNLLQGFVHTRLPDLPLARATL